MRTSFLCALTILTTLSAHALEVDEKLTFRFLKVSDSKKTVLINRGAEDGLVVGDHAKFFITEGVVARGVSEKVSPSRSVWSLYRVIDPAEILQDKVLNLKIATPVKITNDPSKSLQEEPIPGAMETMDIGSTEETKEAKNNDMEVVVTDNDQEELNDLGVGSKKSSAPVKNVLKNSKNKSVVDEIPVSPTSKDKKWEFVGTLNLNSLSGTQEGDAVESTGTAASSIDFTAGIEKYFFQSEGLLKDLSLVGFIHKRTIESGSDIKTTSDWFEYGIGANYHFYNFASDLNRLMGFGGLTIGKGSATIKTKVASSTSASEDQKGDNSFFSIGLGVKYILSNGFGARALFDYYSSSETFTNELGKYKRTLAGPRLQFGLSYRF